MGFPIFRIIAQMHRQTRQSDYFSGQGPLVIFLSFHFSSQAGSSVKDGIGGATALAMNPVKLAQ